jgi:hypothetical protein
MQLELQIAYLQDHDSVGLLHSQPGELKAFLVPLGALVQVRRPVAQLLVVQRRRVDALTAKTAETRYKE